jgi:hypothetical protein
MNADLPAKRALKVLRTIVLPFVAVAIGAAIYLWSLGYIGQIPIAIKSSQSDWEDYDTYIKPNGRLLSSAPWMVTLESGNRQRRDIIIANERDSVWTKFGIEMKSIGTLPKRYPDNSHLRVVPVPNINRRVVAKLLAKGAVYDVSTDGATASCFVFDLQPGQLAEIPLVIEAADNRGTTELMYAMLVKAGDDVSCQSETNTEGRKVFTGLLEPTLGVDFKIDELPVSVGRIN